MMSCRDVSTLLASDGLGAASWRRRVAVRLHLMMCAACRGFAAQLDAMKRGAGAAARAFDDEADGVEERAAKAMEKSDTHRS